MREKGKNEDLLMAKVHYKDKDEEKDLYLFNTHESKLESKVIYDDKRCTSQYAADGIDGMQISKMYIYDGNCSWDLNDHTRAGTIEVQNFMKKHELSTVFHWKSIALPNLWYKLKSGTHFLDEKGNYYLSAKNDHFVQPSPKRRYPRHGYVFSAFPNGNDYETKD